MIRVFLAGEGRHELGGWANEPPYGDAREPGVLEALLRRLRADGWVVTGAKRWKDIPKFRVGQFRDAETRTIRGLAILAHRDGHDVLAFVRDSDHVVERVASIEAAIAEPHPIPVVGGVAVRTIDSRCLALLGTRGSESLRRPKEELEALGCRTTADRVAIVEAADPEAIVEDATSLRAWVHRANATLGGPS